MNHIEVGEEVRVFTNGERHGAAMEALREAGIRLADPSRFAVEQVEALAEVVATFGQLGGAAERTITRPDALGGMAQSEVLGRLLRAASDTQTEAIRDAAIAAGMLWQCACGWYNPEDATRCEAGDPCRAPRPPCAP